MPLYGLSVDSCASVSSFEVDFLIFFVCLGLKKLQVLSAEVKMPSVLLLPEPIESHPGLPRRAQLEKCS